MSDDAYVAPGTRLESAIAGIWRDVLGVEQVGLHDDFFELGGDSLAAVHMLAAVDDLLLTPVSFADFLDAPTVAALGQAVQRARRHQGEAAPALEPGPASGTAPCTFAQERLWFVDQLGGSIGAYNEPVGARIRGRLDEHAVQRCLQELVRRHTALRTAFAVVDGTPQQVFADDVALELERIDLSDRDEPETALRTLTEELASVPFDLERAPLVRAHLLRVADEDHVLQLVFHHNVSDGWSHVIVLRELGILYRAYSLGEQPSLPAPTLQYPDFARWQRSRLAGQALEDAIAPWRERLADIPAGIELPIDRPRPPIQSHEGAMRRGRIDAPTAGAVHSFSRLEGATPFATLLAALDVLLHRYSGQDTIMIGSATAGRDRPELENVVGLFANTIVLRNDLSGDPTFRGLVSRVRHMVLDAVAHQDAPFERLVAELGREPDLSRHPVFQVFISLRPRASLDLPGTTPFQPSLATARGDLTLWIEEAADGFDLVWEYSTDLFEATTIERLERHFVRVLNAALAQPEEPISGLPLLDEEERRLVLERSDVVRPDFPAGCLHELFEAQAAARPAATAVTFNGTTLSYGELSERANQLAHRLRALGIGPDSLVALSLERSLELPVAILAVLKAGGGYVPLDPEWPAERLGFVLSDCKAPILITQEHLLERLPEHGATVICTDRDSEEIECESAENPPPLARPENLAYVIYTSGSTGQPKGVQVEHRNVARLFSATDAWFSSGTSDTWTLLHSYAFDFSVWELWGALLRGGKLVIVPSWTARTPQSLAALLVGERVTVMNATPSLFLTSMDELLQRAGELALRLVIFGGEALQPKSLRPWFERFGALGPEMVNMYGITETTVHVTYRPMTAADVEQDRSPIGVPIPDLGLYLLDGAGAPVPLGVVGELYVGGAGVARGYLNRPELNQERFIDNPFGPGRLYRSGDLGRRLPDGEVEFLGRADDQVKIRGFRIELGEVRAALEEHEAVSESAIVAVKAGGDDTRLAAYVVPGNEMAGPVRTILRLQREGRLTPERLFELPDGASVVHVNPAETEYLYQEIFVRDVYFKHGIDLPPDACVLDVGANIGLFAMLVAQRAPHARIVAFEPMPEVHEVLALNGEIHGLRLHPYDCAVGASCSVASFTYFPHVTLLSGRYADTGADAAAVRQVLEKAGQLDPFEDVEDLLADRFESVTIERPVRTVSGILREQGIERVDLLKIDAEKAELDVLAGIDDADWPRIGQLVIEVHGGKARLEEVTVVLERAGFELIVEEDELLRDSGLYNVYARREPAAPAAARSAPRWRGGQRLRADLRAHLEGRLPQYMVPASITLIDELPLTANGKLDRRALPAPEWEGGREVSFIAPRTPTELQIAEIWKELLEVQRVGAEDSFFHLGGHSLLAARVVARIRASADIELSVRTLFEHPTLAAFAQRVDAAPGTGSAVAEATEEPAPARSGTSQHPLSFQQQQLVFFDQLSPDAVTYNSALAVRVVGALDRPRLRDALAEIYRRHEVLRTVLLFDDSGARQVVLDQSAMALPFEDLSDTPAPSSEAELHRVLREHARRSFDLAHESPLRTTVFRLGPSEHVILFQPHHVAFDGRAVDVLYRELAEIYESRGAGREPVLADLPLQYGDFARWQLERLQGERLAAELDFWRAQLAGAPTTLQLPADHPRPPRQTFDGATLVHRLDAELSERVRELSQAEQVTPYMLLLGAFATLLYRRSGQDDILLGGPMANREQPGFDDVIGFFANTIVVRVRLGGNPTFSELLARVRDSVLESYNHQDDPLALVVDAVRPVRDPSFSPLFQVNFRVRVGAPPMLKLAGTTTTPVPVDLGLARFDLALELHLLGEGIEAEFNWNTALFEPDTIARLGADFERLLAQAAVDPGTRLLSFELELAETISNGAAERSAGIRGFRAGSGVSRR